MSGARPTLKLARPPAEPPIEVRRLALVKKALRLFRGRGIDKATRHRNARKWLKANAMLGEQHLLKGHVSKGNVLQGPTATWGVPGDHANAHGVYAPRRYGDK